ncbi:MAG: hypothetical protein ABSF25_12255 [Bryobacteraceae bacterium]|jgi:hypothetical protein
MPKRFSAALSLLLVFLSGALVGVLAHRAYILSPNHSAAAPRQPGPEDFRKRYVDEMRAKCQLDDQQVVQLEQILDETGAAVRKNWLDNHKRNEDLHNQQIDRINNMLRPEQRLLYEKLRQEREQQMQKDRERDRRSRPPGSPPPPPSDKK